MVRVAPAELIEVDAVHHLDPVVGRVAHRRQLSHGGGERAGRSICTPSGPRRAPRHSTNGTGPDADPLLVLVGREHDLSGSASVERGRQSCAAQQLLDLVAQLVLAGQPQRGQQPERHGLAVAVAGVAGDRLDRMADGVAQVQHLAQAAVALVARHDRELRQRARGDELGVGRARRRRGSAPTASRRRSVPSSRPRRSRRRAPRAAACSASSVSAITAAGSW